MFDPYLIISFLVLGAVVGFMAGLLGIGGGAILVPMLTSIFLWQGVAIDNVVHLALGTSMACIIFTSISSLRSHHKRGGVIWPIVQKMVPGVLIGTFLATFLATLVNSLYLALFFAAFMAYVAFTMFTNKSEQSTKALGGNAALFGTGTFIGGISALVSIGGGSLTVPYLNGRQIEIKKAIGTSAAVGFPIAVAGTLGYVINGWSNAITMGSSDSYILGFVHIPGVILISLISMLTAPLGVKTAHKLPVNTLKKVFAILVLMISVKMVYSVL